MPRRIRGSGDLPVQADINITSMVDVAFTLLVIFIITAPILQGGLQVDMPEADVAPLAPSEEPVYVTIDAENRIFIEDAAVTSLDEFRTAFSQLASSAGWERVYLKADRASVVDTFLGVISSIEAAGVRVSVVAEPRMQGSGR